jgi:hypothetical protein
MGKLVGQWLQFIKRMPQVNELAKNKNPVTGVRDFCFRGYETC